jgi:hypothetical protein
VSTPACAMLREHLAMKRQGRRSSSSIDDDSRAAPSRTRGEGALGQGTPPLYHLRLGICRRCCAVPCAALAQPCARVTFSRRGLRACAGFMRHDLSLAQHSAFAQAAEDAEPRTTSAAEAERQLDAAPFPSACGPSPHAHGSSPHRDGLMLRSAVRRALPSAPFLRFSRGSATRARRDAVRSRMPLHLSAQSAASPSAQRM